jgi:hypothetical protein
MFPLEVAMKKLGILAGMVICVILWTGCTSPRLKKEEAPAKRVLSLPADVLRVEGDLIGLRILKPAPLKAEARLAVALAQGVIDTSYLLEGQEIVLNQTRVRVVRVAGDEVQVKTPEKTAPFKPGDKVVFALERKLIAVKDFEVPVGQNKDAAKYVQEEVESLLVESGQFHIVERSKLGTILEEIQLGQTGAIDPATVQKAGKLLGAELILTGTLIATGEQWNANLRLVNTETGLVIAAIRKVGFLHELKAASFRNIQNIDGSFESGDLEAAGWNMGTRRGLLAGSGGYQRVYVDEKDGASGSKQSLAMDFKLGAQRAPQFQNRLMRVFIRNQLLRDLGSFTEIRFFSKGSDPFTLRLGIVILTEKGEGEEVSWRSEFEVTKDWKEFRIPFTSMVASGGRVVKGQGPRILDMRQVQLIFWSVNERAVPRGTGGTVWLDEVSLY